MINGSVYRSMIVSAANNIANLQDEINKLNVFPVPDGDTGTNMSLTMQAGKNAVEHFSGNLTDCAEKAGIPYQIEVMAGTTGTNADAISVSGKGVRACTLSIPIRYMHTPVEVAKISDIEATGRLIYQYIKEFRHA